MIRYISHKHVPRLVPPQEMAVILRGCCASRCLFCGSTRPYLFSTDRTSAKCTVCCTIMPGE